MQHFHHQAFYLLCDLLLAALCLAGCRSPESNAVSFMVFGDPAEFAAYEALVAAFEAEHPEIQIALGHVAGQGDYRRRLAVDFAGGNPPDVMLLNYRRFAQFAAAGGLEPLGPYLERSALIDAADFFVPTIDAFRYEGELWCIPQNVSSLVVYYNRDLFDAAGLA